jgi:protein AIR1/2
LSINLDQTQTNSPASEQQQRDSRQGSATSTSRGSQSQSSDDWVLPPVPSASEVGVDPKDDRGWEEMFLSWCRSLRQLNQGEIKAGTSRERHPLLEAYYRWVGKVNGLPKIKASAARRVASQYAQQNSEVLVNLFSNTASTVVEPQPSEPIVVPEKDEAQPPPPPSPPPPPMSPAPPLPPGPLPLIGPDAEYQERYYPGIDATAEFCVQCASPGHRAADCLAVVCRFCKTSAHRTFSCPARQRCDKCKQLGHGKRECTEKLKLPADEWECAFCGSRDHADASCHELWRSFAFEAYAGTIRKVRHLPAYCYSCGEEGHHGGVCPLSSKRTKEGPFETWSQANFDKYVDPTTTEIAINFADDVSQAYVTPTDRPDLGKSIVPQRHVFFEDASDDEEEFIRPPVQKAQRVSYISFSSSRSGNQQGDRFGGGGARGPSGLPPHIPPPSFQGRDRRDGGGGGWRGKGRR